MARARPIPGLAADTRFGDGAAAAVEVRTREVFERFDAVRDRGSVDDVHDMRVATRRLRAALEVFAPCFARKRHRRLLGEVKALADALGERRDPDVAIGRLEALAAAFAAADRPGIEGLIAERDEARTAGDERVAEALAAAEDAELERRLVELAQAARA